MENQDLELIDNDSPSVEMATETLGVEINSATESHLQPSTDPEAVFSIIEEAFPQQENVRNYAMPQAMQWLGTRFFAIWVWPIVAINKLRIFIKGIDFVQPYSDKVHKSYSVRDTETVYTMTSKAFSGEGGIKFFGIRFMSIWVFPMAITGAVMEFLFVGPLKGTNPFG